MPPLKKVLVAAFKTVMVGIIMVWSLTPILMIVVSSFKVDRDIFAVPFKIGFQPTLDNYATLWSQWGQFFFGLYNSAVITVFATVLAVFASTLAGYAYSRNRHPALSGSAFFLIFIRLFPPIVITLPLFPVVNALRINDTQLVLIILYAAFFVSLGTLVMRTFIDQIPVEIDEAAHIDGASRWQVLWRLILPLSGQGMVAVAVFVIVFSWNEYLFALVFTTVNAKTAPLVISEMMGAIEGVQWGVLFAATTIQLVPVLLFVLLAQKQLVAGLTAGSTKG
ncbi:MAG TPA: carbohydrate ABC transporter permease [Devosia sp.]|nr:carbohydrate ABC transporter permease [Devosia sp.]